MAKMRVAVATDDGKLLMGRHFGDAEAYEIVDLGPEGSEVVGRVVNDTEEERGHADPEKAKGVAAILKRQGVEVVVARVFGPNLKRIRRRFVCVLTSQDAIGACLEELRGRLDELQAAWDLGEERRHLDFRRR